MLVSSRPRAIAALTCALMLGAAPRVLAQVAPPPYVEPGKPNDPDSWMTKEFTVNWGFGAINAQNAYALGITGKGVKLGIIDDGIMRGRDLAGEGKYNTINTTSTGIEFSGPSEIHPFGSLIAGILADNRNGQGVHGVAFDASLYVASGADLFLFNVLTSDSDNFRNIVDAFVADDVHIINAGFEGNSLTTLDSVVSEYMAPRSVPILEKIEAETGLHNLLWVNAAGLGGSQAVPNSFASIPYFRTDLEGHFITATSMSLDQGDEIPIAGTPYSRPPRATQCAQTRAWCVAAPGRNAASDWYKNHTSQIAAYNAALLDPDEPANRALIKELGPDAQYIDTVNHTWFAASLAYGSGNRVVTPMVTGMVGLLAQRFPWATMSQLTQIVLTTARYLPDGSAVDSLPGNTTLVATQIPNLTTGWGLIDAGVAMNWPAQMLRSEVYMLPDRTSAVFSNNITDAWLTYEKTMLDPAEEAAWQAEIVAKGWQGGLPNNATNADIAEYTYQASRDDARWNRSRTDAGSLIKDGQGTLTLTGNNSYSGVTEIRGGQLFLDGVNSKSPVTVESSGTLGGSGTGYGLLVQSGGVVAPGHGIGMLHFGEGGIRLKADAIYRGELGALGRSDLITTTGAARIDGAKLMLAKEGSQTSLSGADLDQLLDGQATQLYTLLSAEMGVSGAFDTSALSQPGALQRLSLTYQTNAVTLKAIAKPDEPAPPEPVITPIEPPPPAPPEPEIASLTPPPAPDVPPLSPVVEPVAPLPPAPPEPETASLTPPPAPDVPPPSPVVEPVAPLPPAPPEPEIASLTPPPAPDAPPSSPVVEPVAPLPPVIPPPSKPAIVDVTIAPGARYTVGADTTGMPEPLITTGTATIVGSHLVLPKPIVSRLVKLVSKKGQLSTYEVLTAQEGLAGTFMPNELPQFTFFNVGLNYSTNTVTLDVGRNTLGFADIAVTPNQHAVAEAAEGLGPDNVIRDTILYTPNALAAIFAYQNLTGELHADVAGEVLDDSHIMRDAVLDRMTKRTPDTASFWMKTIGSFGTTAADGNAVKVHRQTDGLMGGADAMIGGSWIIGVAANYEGTPLRTDGMGSASLTSYHLAGYGGGDVLGLALHLGGAYGHYHAKTTRLVLVPGLEGVEQASYGANQGQAFGEIGVPLRFDDTTVEPFAGIAYTEASLNGFGETGGPASLTANDQTLDRTQTALGARLTIAYRDNATVFLPNLSLAWAHNLSGVRPGVQLAFVDGPSTGGFTIYGATADRDAAVIRAGLDATIGGGFSVGAGYEGQIGAHAQDHGVRLDIRVNY